MSVSQASTTLTPLPAICARRGAIAGRRFQ